MALLELKGYGVAHGPTRLAGVDLAVEPSSMLAVVGRGDGAISLLALAIANLLPKGAATEGTLTFAGKRVLYLDRDADASAVVADADLIVADEPGRGRDPATQLALLSALQQASRTAAVLLFTADFRLALTMGLEVAVAAGGKLLLRAPASQIFELPQYDTVRHLVGGQRLRTRTLMRPPIGEPVLELKDLAKSFRRGLPRLGPPAIEALKGIGFAVRQGEVVGILGPGGAGKSTLLRLIAGLESPSAGHVGRREGLIGYVFSDPRKAFNPTLPVGVSLTEPLRVEQTLLVEEQADRLVEVVRAVGLEPELLTRLPGEFGVADLQRMALARALVGRPTLLLLDDPTAALDPAETREFLLLFARVRADFGLTAIIATREFEVVRALADRLLVLEAGHIVEGGKPAELSEAPKQEITRRLVSLRYPGPAKFEPVAVAVVEPVAEAAVPPSEPEPMPEPAVADIVQVEAPSTALDGPPPPLGGGEPQRDPVPEAPEPAAPIPALAAPEPVPEPVHTLSAEIVIAPIVLPDPAPVAPASPPEIAVEPGPDPEPVTPPPETEAAHDPAPAAAATQPEAAPPPEPQPAAEPVPVPSGDGADEAAEGGQAERAVGGLVDAAGGPDAPDGEASR